MSLDFAIRASGLAKSFVRRGEEVKAFRDVDFTVLPGEFVSLLGPSGCGKSTLLRVLNGLEQHNAGTLDIAREPGRASAMSTVFQQESVLPWMTVTQNVGYGLPGKGRTTLEKELVRQLIESVGLSEFRNAYPAQLSGGMKQRAAVARALAVDPSILFMDEPFGALDEQTREALQGDLLQIWSQTNKTIVFVTHSIDEALFLSDRILVMSSRPGTISTEFKVPFGRPRDHLEMRSDERYAVLMREIHSSLKAPEAMSTDRAERTVNAR